MKNLKTNALQAFVLEAYGAGALKACTRKSKSAAEKKLKILRDLGSDEADELAEFIQKKERAGN